MIDLINGMDVAHVLGTPTITTNEVTASPSPPLVTSSPPPPSSSPCDALFAHLLKALPQFAAAHAISTSTLLPPSASAVAAATSVAPPPPAAGPLVPPPIAVPETKGMAHGSSGVASHGHPPLHPPHYHSHTIGGSSHHPHVHYGNHLAVTNNVGTPIETSVSTTKPSIWQDRQGQSSHPRVIVPNSPATSGRTLNIPSVGLTPQSSLSGAAAPAPVMTPSGSRTPSAHLRNAFAPGGQDGVIMPPPPTPAKGYIDVSKSAQTAYRPRPALHGWYVSVYTLLSTIS
jgi:hypothetical protein